MLVLLLFLLTTNLFLEIAFANNNLPKYVGLRENQEIVWNTNFDKDPYREYLEDSGATNESLIEDYLDYIFDGIYDTTVKGWRIFVLKIYEEEEREYKGKNIDYIEFSFNWYVIETLDLIKSWEIEEKNDRARIEEYNKDIYLNAMSYGGGLLELWVAKDTDWSELEEEFENELDDEDEDGNAKVETTTFFFQTQKCGISTKLKDEKGFKSISRYTKDGILLLYESFYDGDIIMKIELDNAYLIENWWWLSLILVFSLLGIIIVTILISKKRKQKKENTVPAAELL